jgi:diguanylate cyclase (GGDEF)-like protein
VSEEQRQSADHYILRAVQAAGGAVYHWDLATDRIVWSDNVRQVLGVSDPELIGTGRAYTRLLEDDEAEARLQAILGSRPEGRGGESRTFCAEYALRPRGRGNAAVAHVEECGCWQPGENGRPAHVYGLVRRIDDRRRLEEQVELFGQYDVLTGLLNRGRFNDLLEDAVGRAGTDGPVAFLLASVDNLDVIADAYGYAVADDVVRIVGRRLRRVARGEDVVARYADSKFGLILHDCREEDLQVAMGRFLSVAGERMIETGSGPVWARLSIGAVLLPDHAASRDEAIAAAEEALAEAAGRDHFRGVVFRPEPNRISQRVLNARCAAEVVEALRHNRFTLAFQPIVRAADEQPVMHESLLRLRTREGEVLAAGHLIPVAEKLGLIRLVDYNVLELAAVTLRAHPEARLTMNISGTTTGDPHWNGRFLECLEANADIAGRLVVEIAETTVLDGLAETAEFISRLRQLGCQVAIDHFGAGYSSYKNLKVLDVDIVKLDGSFCENLSENLENQYFVRSLIDLARKMDLKVVAEWVQTEADAAMLRDWGVDYLQGHLYGTARIDDPWPSPGLEGEPGILARLESPEELADLTSPILFSTSAPGAGRRSARAAEEVPAVSPESAAEDAAMPAMSATSADVGKSEGEKAAMEAASSGAGLAEAARSTFASFTTGMPARTEVATSLLPADRNETPPASGEDTQERDGKTRTGKLPLAGEVEAPLATASPQEAETTAACSTGPFPDARAMPRQETDTGSHAAAAPAFGARVEKMEAATPAPGSAAPFGRRQLAPPAPNAAPAAETAGEGTALRGLREITSRLNAELDTLRNMLQELRKPPLTTGEPGDESGADAVSSGPSGRRAAE